MNLELIKQHIRTIPNFPKEGVMFRDVTTMFKNPECLHELAEGMTELYRNKGITKVLGIESRGFIMGPVVANNIGAGFVTIRKPGKLPADVYTQEYAKEYGTDRIEIHKDALCADDVVLIHDDLLATGGTMKAAYDLVKKLGVKKVYINFIIELAGEFDGRGIFPADVEVTSLIKY